MLVKQPSLSQSRAYSTGYNNTQTPPRGHIVIQFDVSEDGSVLNGMILEPAQEDLQGEARRALDALGKSYYRPRLIDGVVVYTGATIWRNEATEADSP